MGQQARTILLTAVVLGGGVGARTIKIREAAGNIKVTESSQASDGEEFSSEIMGPAAARNLVLEDYLHLLD